MSYYGYQYEQQRCFIPGGVKSPSAAFPQPCPGPGLLPCSSCSPCAASCSPCGPAGAKLCTVRKTLASPCLETRVVEGHQRSSSSSSSCSSSRCLGSCPAPFPQPLAQGGAVAVLRRCPQVCQDSSCPFSYQWSNSYQYSCGQ